MPPILPPTPSPVVKPKRLPSPISRPVKPHVLRPRPTPTPRPIPPPPPVELSYYNCAALERLWISVGGNPSRAFMAAEIAMAESGGNPRAVSPTDDFGLWQINGSHGSMATLDPIGNARSAVSISANGTNWYPWTTYTSGAYYGRC
jgi:hypothetical protein